MECEVKFKIEDKKEILGKLKNLGAENLGEEKQVDLIFDSPRKSGFRLRKVGKEGIITLKKMVKTKGRAKVREELEAKVSDVDNLVEIFKSLGFFELKRREKVRRAFKLGKVLVLVDCLPFMGYFVEIEAASQAALKKAAKKLGFDYRQAIADSYDNLFFKYYIKNARKFQNTRVKILPVFESEKAFLKGKNGH